MHQAEEELANRDTFGALLQQKEAFEDDQIEDIVITAEKLTELNYLFEANKQPVLQKDMTNDVQFRVDLVEVLKDMQ